tara:strand:- start:1402 stop:1611 length:210 start_codon:yes stop_codon:yes gene_type:complete
MPKRKCIAFVQDFSKKLKIIPSKKRQVSHAEVSIAKRQKAYQYWHEAPLTREQRAFKMSKIYEHLLLCK